MKKISTGIKLIISFLFLFSFQQTYSQSTGGKTANPTKPSTEKTANPTKPREGDGSSLHSDSTSNDCTITDLPSIFFKGGTIRLDKQVMLILNTISDKLKASPTCNIKLSGHGSADKDKQQLSWDQVNSAKNYLIENRGISSKRIIIEYGIEGEPNTVDMMGTTEDGPNTQPAPHPDLRRL